MPKRTAAQRSTSTRASRSMRPKASPTCSRLPGTALSTIACEGSCNRFFCTLSHGDAKQRRSNKRAPDRQCRDGRVLIRPIGLNHPCGPRLPSVALQGDGHQSTPQQSVQPPTSAKASSRNLRGRVGPVCLRHWAARASAFRGEVSATSVRHPELNRPKPCHATGVAVFLNP